MKLLTAIIITLFSFGCFAESYCNYDWQLLYTPTGKTKNYLEKNLRRMGYRKTDARHSSYRVGVESSISENITTLKVVIIKLPYRPRSTPFVSGSSTQKIKNLPFDLGVNLALKKAVKISLAKLPKCPNL